MTRLTAAAACVALILGSAAPADAQNWQGFYLGGSVGGGVQPADDDETVRFDTNLDGLFTDSVRTLSGIDAFSPGFCGGLAVGPTAAAGCTDDEDGIDFGGRLGYDWQVGRLVLGGLLDVSRTDVSDSATAFSTTPAFYAFTRQLEYAAGLRGRVGAGTDRVLVYATGGGAWGSIEQSFTTSNGVNTFVAVDDDADDDDMDDDEGPSESVWGYQAGGGVEFRFGPRVSLLGEYLFTSFDNREDSTVRAQGPAPATNPFILVNPAGTDLQRTDRFEFQTIRVGLNYRF